ARRVPAPALQVRRSALRQDRGGRAMRRGLVRLLGLTLLMPLLMAAAVVQAAFTITRTSSPTFFTDTSVSPTLVCNYQSFSINSSSAVADAWVRISSFSGFLALG